MSFFITFKKIPAVRLFVALTFVFGNILASYYFLELWKIDRRNQQLTATRVELENQLRAVQSGINYENSGLYFERKLKQENFVLQGEKVIDTSILESSEVQTNYYYLPPQSQPTNNLEVWVKCLIKGDDQTTIEYLASNCK